VVAVEADSVEEAEGVDSVAEGEEEVADAVGSAVDVAVEDSVEEDEEEVAEGAAVVSEQERRL